MKRVDLLRHLAEHGCELFREGGRHAVYWNPANRKTSAVPRHSEIVGPTAASICKDLGIPKPGKSQASILESTVEQRVATDKVREVWPSSLVGGQSLRRALQVKPGVVRVSLGRGSDWGQAPNSKAVMMSGAVASAPLVTSSVTVLPSWLLLGSQNHRTAFSAG